MFGRWACRLGVHDWQPLDVHIGVASIMREHECSRCKLRGFFTDRVPPWGKPK